MLTIPVVTILRMHSDLFWNLFTYESNTNFGKDALITLKRGILFGPTPSKLPEVTITFLRQIWYWEKSGNETKIKHQCYQSGIWTTLKKSVPYFFFLLGQKLWKLHEIAPIESKTDIVAITIMRRVDKLAAEKNVNGFQIKSHGSQRKW